MSNIERGIGGCEVSSISKMARFTKNAAGEPPDGDSVLEVNRLNTTARFLGSVRGLSQHQIDEAIYVGEIDADGSRN